MGRRRHQQYTVGVDVSALDSNISPPDSAGIGKRRIEFALSYGDNNKKLVIVVENNFTIGRIQRELKKLRLFVESPSTWMFVCDEAKYHFWLAASAGEL